AALRLQAGPGPRCAGGPARMGPARSTRQARSRRQIGTPLAAAFPMSRASRRSATRSRESDMRALCWHGKKDIRYDTVPDPGIEHPRDAIIKVSACAICGSDLHLFDGFMPGMKSGDIMGHEFMGEVVEVGKENTALRPGDRVVIPFPIICGQCDQ